MVLHQSRKWNHLYELPILLRPFLNFFITYKIFSI